MGKKANMLIVFLIIFILLLILSNCEQQVSKEEMKKEDKIPEGCTDTEGNVTGIYDQDFRTKGTVISKYWWEAVSASGEFVPFGEKTDYCSDEEQLTEYGCAIDGKNAEIYNVFCSEVVGKGYTCKDGACVRENEEETTVIADCGGPYAVTLGVPFTFDGTKSQGDINYYEVSFGDESAEFQKIRANVTDSSQILLEHTYKEVGIDNVGEADLMVRDNTGTIDRCQVFFTVSE